MSDSWKDNGHVGGFLDLLIPGPISHEVENTETGETREVYVGSNQSVGEAIANGQFSDKS